jgi:molybdate transport system substrate-binding protein
MMALALFLALSAPFTTAQAGDTRLVIAAAADLKYALDEIVTAFRQDNPQAVIEVVYGSSGRISTQIRQGAPYDLFFSADIEYPRLLQRDGFAGSDVRRYAFGRLVLWSRSRQLNLKDLAGPTIKRIAIANPRHAPYGKRAEQALRAAGVWEAVKDKLVLGESVAQAAQFVESGSADVGIVALSLALAPALAGKGAHAPVADKLYEPLEQGFIVTRRAAGNALARAFAGYIETRAAREIMTRYGFSLPVETSGKVK